MAAMTMITGLRESDENDNDDRDQGIMMIISKMRLAKIKAEERR